MAVLLEPSIAGALIAIGAVGAGAPLFAGGLRALRLSRAFARLEDRALGDPSGGFARVRGRVVLESPLFGPLSGAPCAGFELIVVHEGTGVVATVAERRPFRLVADGVGGRVEVGSRRWTMTESSRRTLDAGETPTQHVEALLARAPEVLRLRRSGAALTLVERALRAGAECHVVGQLRFGHALELPAEAGGSMLRTGTDDAPVAVAASGAATPETPDLWIDEGGTLDFLLVSDTPIARPALAWAGVRTLGLAAGPLLSLAGLLYLAHAADRLHELGRF